MANGTGAVFQTGSTELITPLSALSGGFFKAFIATASFH
jgi:hypothetical protein